MRIENRGSIGNARTDSKSKISAGICGAWELSMGVKSNKGGYRTDVHTDGRICGRIYQSSHLLDIPESW